MQYKSIACVAALSFGLLYWLFHHSNNKEVAPNQRQKIALDQSASPNARAIYDNSLSSTDRAALADNSKKFRDDFLAPHWSPDDKIRGRQATSICSQYIHLGMTVEEVDALLHRSGSPGGYSIPALIDGSNYNFTYCVPLYHSFVASAAIVVDLRLSDLSTGERVVDGVYCNVMRSAL
jgi:hypothetical protein